MTSGHGSEFAARTERHRRELHVHCYRMLASFDEAEDAVQETLLRAWRARDSFEGDQRDQVRQRDPGSQGGTRGVGGVSGDGDCGLDGGGEGGDDARRLRAWLYRIATNVCLDQLRRSSRRLTTLTSFAEVPWLQPYPDGLLDEVAPATEEPDAVVVQRETIELAFLAALQLLPPRQRAAFVARDVLGWPANDSAELLGTSVAAANSALQRARATMRAHVPARRADWSAGEPTAEERELLARFIAAHESGDTAAAVALSARDIRITMPPHPMRYDGAESIPAFMARAFGPELGGDWRLLPTRANRMPTAASYLRRRGDTAFRAFKFDVLRVGNGLIREITTFGPDLFPAFGLPATL